MSQERTRKVGRKGSVVAVSVLVDDNGAQYDTTMLAGQFAYDMVGSTRHDTVRPRNDWCIAFLGKPKAMPRNYIDGEVRSSTDNV